MKIAKVPVVTPVSRQLTLLFDARVPGGIELTGTEQGEATAGTDPDASCRPQRRGA